MSREFLVLEYQQARLHYCRSGEGKSVLFLFHGYGQSMEQLRELEKVLSAKYTIYSFDLFYHGGSFWHEKDQPLSKTFWRQMLTILIERDQIKKISLLGFSMGGKFALASLEAFPDQVERLILLAPDGVVTSFWYVLATFSKCSRAVFRRMILMPSWYVKVASLLSLLGLVNKGVMRFANTQMRTLTQRRRVYYSWIIFRELKFNFQRIASICNTNNIQVEIFLGEFDKMINAKSIKKELRLLHHYELAILSAGHSNLIQAVTAFFKRKISRDKE